MYLCKYCNSSDQDHRCTISNTWSVQANAAMMTVAEGKAFGAAVAGLIAELDEFIGYRIDVNRGDSVGVIIHITLIAEKPITHLQQFAARRLITRLATEHNERIKHGYQPHRN